jgi:hypothetical protein
MISEDDAYVAILSWWSISYHMLYWPLREEQNYFRRHACFDVSVLFGNQSMIFHEILNVCDAMAQIEVQIMTFVIIWVSSFLCCIFSLRQKYTRSVKIKAQLPLCMLQSHMAE